MWGGEDREGKDGKPLGPSREEAGQATIDNVPTVMNQFTLWASVSSSVECGTYCSGNGRKKNSSQVGRSDFHK